MKARGMSLLGVLRRLLAVIGIAAVVTVSSGGQAFAKAQTDKVVYLTFDDGPSANTGMVLDILRKTKIKATFFVVGNQVEQRPALLKRIVKEGHSVGNHTYDHVYQELYGSFRGFAEQVVKTGRILDRTAGVRTRLLRAPGGTFGNFDAGYFEALKEAGYIVEDWNVDSGDSKRRDVPASEILDNVTGTKLKSRMVVLMHDGSGHAETVKALPKIIEYFAKKGYKFARLTDKDQPVVFRVAPQLKWKRTIPSKEEAVAWLGGKDAALNPPSPVEQREPEPDAAELQQWNLVPEDLQWLHGKPYVALRLWLERSGGTARWDAKTHSVIGYLQGYELTFPLDPGDAAGGGEPRGTRRIEVGAVWPGGTPLVPISGLEKLRQAFVPEEVAFPPEPPNPEPVAGSLP